MILGLNGVSKSFGSLMAVHKVTFGVDKMELVALIGPNGAGKTTLFNLISGFLRPSEGQIILEGESIDGLPPHQISRRGIALAFQLINIFPRLSVLENIQVGLFSSRGMAMDLRHSGKGLLNKDAGKLIAEVGISSHLMDVKAQNLSQADKKRVEIAIALACNPKLLILDEPTSGQSNEETVLIMNLIKKLREERTLTILFTEHKMPVVFGVAERIIVMHFGEIIADGSPESIRQDERVKKSYLGESL